MKAQGSMGDAPAPHGQCRLSIAFPGTRNVEKTQSQQHIMAAACAVSPQHLCTREGGSARLRARADVSWAIQRTTHNTVITIHPFTPVPLSVLAVSRWMVAPATLTAVPSRPEPMPLSTPARHPCCGAACLWERGRYGVAHRCSVSRRRCERVTTRAGTWRVDARTTSGWTREPLAGGRKDHWRVGARTTGGWARGPLAGGRERTTGGGAQGPCGWTRGPGPQIGASSGGRCRAVTGRNAGPATGRLEFGRLAR